MTAFDLTLSFDNGPDEETTPRVLDTLRDRGILSTFFVVGKQLAQPAGRRLAQRARDEGHWIGNHTFTHSVPLGLPPDPEAAANEIGRTQKLIGDLAHPARLFRPFGGGGHLDRRLLSPSAVDFLLRQRFTCVLWNAIPGDWKDPDGWTERALAQCRQQPWTLMVLHDLPTGAMRHLAGFLDRAADAGARFLQDFPPQCVPIRQGAILLPIDAYLNPGDQPQ